MNYFLEIENLIFPLCLSHSFILGYQKMLDYILLTILLKKFQTKEKFNKLHLIIHQILTFRTLRIFTKISYETIFFFR